ncbi:MAG: EamA family transporter RarD [Corynebacteriales bacterium]|nr:EamA family transporter RarD [Mycobacteriales bacterium]
MPSPATPGIGLCLLANTTWGLQVLYWPLFAASKPVELLAHRFVWAALTCLIVAFALGRAPELLALLRNRQALLYSSLAALCLAISAGTYIYAISSHQVVQSSLGLYLIPLMTAALSVLLFRERLGTWQWAAAALAIVATLILAISYGQPPWIALTICVLTATYAVIKKHAALPALTGFTLEGLLMCGPALIFLYWLSATGQQTVAAHSWKTVALIATSGLVTTVPLVANAAAINIAPLATVGILQYLNPSLQLLIGITIGGEAVSGVQWLCLALIGCALSIFVTDSMRERTTPKNLASPTKGT